MGKLDGKVALITGAARGQGRAQATRLAEEGADIVALDIAGQSELVPYVLGTDEDLAVTGSQVEALGRRALCRRADVTDRDALDAAVAAARDEFGRIDILVANAGVGPRFEPTWEVRRENWDHVLAVNLTGVWQTIVSVVPLMLERGEGGSIIAITSVAGQKGVANIASYVSAKWGVEGLVRTLALELGPQSIRVNTVAPGVVNTPLHDNEEAYRLYRPDLENPTLEDTFEVTRAMNLLPTPYMEAIDVANAVAWLASDEARYITGTTTVVDAGQSVK